MSAPAPSSKTKSRDLSRELEEGIKPWIGPSVFSTTPSSPFNQPRSRSRQNSSQESQDQGTGSSSSPIDISSAESSPIQVRRPRGIARYQSPLPATAFTPPRPSHQEAIHPFFQRTKSLPPPPSQRPRLVAHYSSTESSSQQTETTDTQSTFVDASSEVTDRVTRPEAVKESTSAKGKGKEKAKTSDPIPGFSDAAIDAIANEFANVDIGSSRAKPIAASATSTKSELPKIRSNVKPSISTIPSISSDPSGPSKSYPKGRVVPKPSTYSRLPLIPQAPPSNEAPPSKPKPKSRSRPKLDDPSIEYFNYLKVSNPPAVVYTTDPDEVNDLIGCLKGDVFGFDLEWPPMVKTYDKKAKAIKFGQGKTALIQICDRDTVLLIHMKTMTQLPEKLIEFIQDSSKFMVGVAIGGDGSKLMRDFNPVLSRVVSCLELSKLARRVDGEALGAGNTLISLTNLSKRYLGFPLSKDPNVRSGNWAGTLDQQQKDYAANDVYASLGIHDKLIALGNERAISVDRRSLCSDHGNFREFIPRSTSPYGVNIPNMARRNSTSLDPSPAQARTIAMFIEGKSTEEIALEMGVKRTTAQSYLAEGIGRVDEDILSDQDKRRFLEDTKDNIWISRRHGPVVAQVRKELGLVDGQVSASDVVPEQTAEAEVEEAEEDIEQEVSEEEEVVEVEVVKKV